MKIVGLTGGIACGKSAVSTLLRDTHSLPLVDADLIAKEALDDGAPAYHKVVAAFGQGILEPAAAAAADGDRPVDLSGAAAGRPIDRKKLGEIVFNDVALRRKLNGIVSGYIARGMGWEVLKHFALGTPVIVLDVPLLYETGANRACSEVVVVSVTPATQLARLTKRDTSTEQEASARINSQMPLADKVERADIVVDNDGSEEALAQRVASLAPRLVRRTSPLQWLCSGPVLFVALQLVCVAPWFIR